MSDNLNDILLQKLPREMLDKLQLPPNIFVEMNGEFIEYEEDKLLVARFPNKECYQNPFGYMQGGIIGAAIDNTVAPFSYLVSPVNITKSIKTKFIRPVLKDYDYIFVKVTVGERSDEKINFEGEVRNKIGKLLAIAIVECVFI